MWKLIKACIWIGGVFLLLMSVLCIVLQTRYAKDKLRTFILQAADQYGIELSIGHIGGGPPMRWTFEDVVIRPTPTDLIEIPELRFSVSFLPLLSGDLFFKRVLIRDAKYTFSESRPLFIPHVDLPFSLSFKDMIISAMDVKNLAMNTEGTYSVYAKGKIERNAGPFFIDARFSMPTLPDASGEIYAAGNRKENHIGIAIKLSIPSLSPFYPLYVPSFDADLTLRAEIESEWDSLPLKTDLQVQLRKLSLPGLPEIQEPSLTHARFKIEKDRSFVLENLSIKGDFLNVVASSKLSPDLDLEDLSAEVVCKNLSPFMESLKGAAALNISFSDKEALLNFSTTDLIIEGHPFDLLKAKMHALRDGNCWEGETSFVLNQEEIHAEGKTIFNIQNELLNLEEITLQGSDILGSGNFHISLSSWDIEGGLYAYIQNLHRFAKWAPFEHLGGSLAISTKIDTKALTTATLYIKNLDSDPFLASEIHVDAQISDFWRERRGSFSFEGERIYFPKFYFSTLSLDASSELQGWKFSLKGNGLWKDPLSFEASGLLSDRKLSFDAIQGSLLRYSGELESPFSVSWTDDEFHLTPSQWKLGAGSFYAQADLTPDSSDVVMKAEKFPLELLALSTPEFTLTGICSLDVALKEENAGPQGRVSFLLEEASILQAGKSSPLLAKGNLQLNLDKQILQIHSDLKATGGQFFEGTATLPLKGRLFPWTLNFEEQLPIAAGAVIEGRLEEIFDFINIGSHKLTGLVSGHLYLSKNLLSPSLIGTLEVQEGSYENYVTGTYLKGIHARASAENNRIVLTEFDAKDTSEGTLAATGELYLQVGKHFPYSIEINFCNLNTLNYDSFTSDFTGPLKFHGNMQKALAEGVLTVSSANFRIPDQLPTNIPDLPITYINQPPHLRKHATKRENPFPIDLDIQLSANNKIFVRGRGLNSEWEGSVHLGGSNAKVSANGSLHLLKGEFVFSGKVFTLTQGEITFANKNSQEAFLSLNGTLNMPDATITALLRGPLTSPQLSFQSVPPMPTSSILARILFNKDISEISPMQAIQIAQAIVTLSGGAGPDVLEAIRKSLGVDRLSIVSSQSGSDEISVQIGKYLTRGVMVTLSQSAESSQVIVEVELSQGFIFQAETQEEEEGKFTLKWNKNY